MQPVSEDFLDKLVHQLDDANTVGIALAGSFARGAGGRYSDVDLWHFVQKEPEGKTPALRLIDGYLVSVKALLIEKERASLQAPRQAIWAVLPMRQARILVDRQGQLESLFQEARDFRWEPLQREADRFASNSMGGLAEEVYKILDGLAKGAESKVAYALWSLTQDMASAVLVWRGVLVQTENVFIDCAQSAAGRDSEWTRQFRLAVGLDTGPGSEAPYRSCGKAGLRLYQASATLLKGILLPEDKQLVEHALKVITESGEL